VGLFYPAQDYHINVTLHGLFADTYMITNSIPELLQCYFIAIYSEMGAGGNYISIYVCCFVNVLDSGYPAIRENRENDGEKNSLQGKIREFH
jgi:hypothetical protein